MPQMAQFTLWAQSIYMYTYMYNVGVDLLLISKCTLSVLVSGANRNVEVRTYIQGYPRKSCVP